MKYKEVGELTAILNITIDSLQRLNKELANTETISTAYVKGWIENTLERLICTLKENKND